MCPHWSVHLLLQCIHPDLCRQFRDLRRRPDHSRRRGRLPLNDCADHSNRNSQTSQARYDGWNRVYLSHCRVHAIVLGGLRVQFYASGQDVLAGSLHHPNRLVLCLVHHVLLLARDSSMVGEEWFHERSSSDSCRPPLKRRYRGKACARSVCGDPRGRHL